MVKVTYCDALIVVDVQKDFLPGGALPVPEGDKVIGPLNRYIELFVSKGQPIFATRDWHPENHISFKENGGLWPKHCVQWSEGACFAKELNLPPDTFIINKGDRPELEAYSGFQGTLLDTLLRERGIKRVFIGGLATDYCVKNTVLGALNLGYVVFFLEDASRGVDVTLGDSKRAKEEMLEKGAIALKFEDLK
ncbi:Nicotinamidase [Desulfurobacterium thermolithotrophum DSM 11699]|uniref:nicotinamidase n=1 Tax=Desulfurobacterium thermolithotrophum (strain DSM 11699 / BSA) TaxID=868864 RepID=F0S2R1_DESTD|nr:nicotinamidase [Desulfurobacterium thermolithotrophum]ADY73133.1 Nicotinamidase [Desulfurobacterium thermolithotrophum DSM 11699]